MKLSIIIPYYNTYKYIKKLFKVLEPQLTDEIEVIIVDDGCNCKDLDKLKAKVIHLKENSGTASIPRNKGLDIANGEYIAFIDSDDMITDNYIEEIMKKIERKPDIIYLSWYSKVHDIIMVSRPKKWNCSVWCRVYKKDIIGNIRFKPELKIAEDYIFNKEVKPKTSLCIKKQIYIYNNGREGSLTNEY